jgi:AbrB family looped-hinge helix DNA binding protein
MSLDFRIGNGILLLVRLEEINMIMIKATTKLSSKGQVVIPEAIRVNLKLKTGDSFLVYGKDDTIVFKAAPDPSNDEFEAILAEAKDFARKIRLKASDVTKAIKRVRNHK